MEVPAGGRAPGSTLKGARGRIDQEARTTIARELWHNRRAVSETYLGK